VEPAGDFIGSAAERREIVRLEQPQTFLRREPFSGNRLR
jgi:hypothetical protein